jgi:hypothetical protein
MVPDQSGKMLVEILSQQICSACWNILMVLASWEAIVRRIMVHASWGENVSIYLKFNLKQKELSFSGRVLA